MSWTVRMTLKMRDVVDGDLLRQAVELARQRYPYYQVKLGIRKDDAGTETLSVQQNGKTLPLSLCPTTCTRSPCRNASGVSI